MRCLNCNSNISPVLMYAAVFFIINLHFGDMCISIELFTTMVAFDKEICKFKTNCVSREPVSEHQLRHENDNEVMRCHVMSRHNK